MNKSDELKLVNDIAAIRDAHSFTPTYGMMALGDFIDAWREAIAKDRPFNYCKPETEAALVSALELAEATIKRLAKTDSANGTLNVIRNTLRKAGA